ncbi:MAG TPA: isoaspartyl peptidase/L-asparaginase [Flavisolibacter sp.]|jgi:beta-aspartyl-peptidase (threonine type)|nr:isoaspartyl peptidase/L-asparaginase [Flavisolibacter sp.]
MKQKIALAVHGGAGTILKSKMTAELEKAYTEALYTALKKGYELLMAGGSSLDAVEIAVRELEDCPLYNAGKGAVFTADGKNELDASIMFGKDLSAGAVAEVTNVKNPIVAARAVMEKSEHVMMVGRGAEEFARLHGLEMVDQDYFFTQERWEALQRIREEDPNATELDHGSGKATLKKLKEEKFGTVGAVALDVSGNLAAATSTGGMTNKKWGRVGDSPIIGAGTYANHLCAVSCTGWGEFFLRLCAAKTVADLMEYKAYSLAKATGEVILKKLPQLGGDGGLVAVDHKGGVSLPFNTEGMYRGFVKNNGKIVVEIYK